MVWLSSITRKVIKYANNYSGYLICNSIRDICKVSQNPTFYQNGYPKLLNRDTDQAEMFYHGPVFCML